MKEAQTEVQRSRGLADIAVMWRLLGLTIARFWPVSRLAGLLLLPYLAWISFAGFLNSALWRLNP